MLVYLVHSAVVTLMRHRVAHSGLGRLRNTNRLRGRQQGSGSSQTARAARLGGRRMMGMLMARFSSRKMTGSLRP